MSTSDLGKSTNTRAVSLINKFLYTHEKRKFLSKAAVDALIECRNSYYKNRSE